MLALHRPGEWHSVCAFWHGADREFSGWYVNIQEPFRRTELGFDTQDLELDIWIPNGGSWEWKDAELLDQRVREGRYTADQMAIARAEGARITAELDAGRRWWDEAWAEWAPDPSWPVPVFPDGFLSAAA
jgi:predicted RNA-binding protein associated with RNAse of E/G family